MRNNIFKCINAINVILITWVFSFFLLLRLVFMSVKLPRLGHVELSKTYSNVLVGRRKFKFKEKPEPVNV